MSNVSGSYTFDAGQVYKACIEWIQGWFSANANSKTIACGTGTCATVVAAILNGLVDAGEKITVHLLGGDLQIEWSGKEGESVFMTGPAENVFTGEIKL